MMSLGATWKLWLRGQHTAVSYLFCNLYAGPSHFSDLYSLSILQGQATVHSQILQESLVISIKGFQFIWVSGPFVYELAHS